LGAREEARVETARRIRWRVGVAAGIVVLLLVLVAVVEGDIPEAFSDLTSAISHRTAGLGPAASFVVLYFEESGVPLPVPGDVFVSTWARRGQDGRPC
jgi:hypothetical protein